MTRTIRGKRALRSQRDEADSPDCLHTEGDALGFGRPGAGWGSASQCNTGDYAIYCIDQQII